MGLTLTGYNDLPGFEGITLVEERIPYNAACFLATLGIVFFVGFLYEKWLYRIPMNILLALACIGSGIVSLCWLRVTLPVPESDQLAVFNCAKEYLQGATWMFDKGGYMSIYQNNLGLMTVHVLLIKLFGETAFVQFQILLGLAVPLLVLSGYKITGYLTEDKKAQFIYLFLAVMCIPMYCYTTFVYNDLLSTVLVMVTAWTLLSCHRDFKLYKLLLLGILSGITVAIRTNTVIVFIAFGIVLLVNMLREQKGRMAAMVLSIVLGIVMIHGLMVWHYQIPENADSVPAMAYINMGLHDGNIGPGWYDGSSLAMFTDSGFDATATTATARAEIRVQMEQNKKDMGAFSDFLKRKMATQWESPMYQCFAMSRQYKETAKDWVRGLYDRNALAIALERIMKCYQLLVYGGILVVLIRILVSRKQLSIMYYCLLLATFGGFLFSMMWEAKTRYVFPYFLMLIPYAAMLFSGKRK
ncbi:MAG: hypothetical protein K5682_09355 [Lachnospiraceae bacterium]|nr:hypothetical protein [Lachnospiraceae bacterium]